MDALKDWRQRLGGDEAAAAIMDRIIRNSIIITTGDYNMRHYTHQPDGQ